MTKKIKNQQIGLTLFFIILCALILIPFILLVSISFSNEQAIAREGYSLIPRQFDLAAYKYVFRNPQTILNAYKVTFIFSVVGTFLSVFFMTLLGYMLSRKGIPGKSAVSFYIYFTMLFGGGLVPTYILITQYLNLGNTIWVYILPGLISPWYVFMIRTFFQGIPYELTESAMIDGANEYQIYGRIYIPCSKPVIATVTLFMFLAKWNDWYTAMLYISDESLMSLQYMLQRILQNAAALQNAKLGTIVIDYSQLPTETMRMAMAVVVAGPALIVFPFFQKYFVKGITVGSVKG
ncbi:MAG: carbohydrate ABC transporter permease [Clostridia bacterium]|nr:carbohydrate ABC transporter permease [Clostridia bacterium]